MQSHPVAVRELGFTLLASCHEPKADIFFIHGIQGHPQKTWTYSYKRNAGQPTTRTRLRDRFGRWHAQSSASHNDESKPDVYWPLDLIPKRFPDLRVFTFGYDSKVTNWFKGPAMHLDILSFGESLLNGLVARRQADPDRSLLFVVHSLGGLVLKDALRRARSSHDPRLKAIYRSTKGIVFFGTPHHGGNYVNLGLTAKKIAVCCGFDASDKVLRDLKFDSTVAKMLSEEFTKFLDERKPLVYTFQEGSAISGFGLISGKIVEDVSSSLEYNLQIKDHIYANHMDMCKFSGFDDDGFEKVDAAIQHLMSGDRQAARQDHGTYQRMLASLFLPDHAERMKQVEDAFKGTFEWLFDNPDIGFTNWLRQGSGIFWISGKPASGKSTLLKFAVSNPNTYDLLRQNNPRNRWITGDFFFTNRGKCEQKTVRGLLQRILYQLLSQCKELAPFVQRFFMDHAKYNSWQQIYLEDALEAIMKQRKYPINICLFIDALDEHAETYYETHNNLINYLSSLTQEADGHFVKLLLCVTSRPENIFVDRLRNYPGFAIQEFTGQDVRTYVRSRMTDYLDTRPEIVADPAAVKCLNAAYGEIIRRAQGVFLWVKLVVTDIIEGLRDGDTHFDIRDKVDAIPGDGDLQQLYAGILLRLKPHYLHEAFLMLWLAYAAREPMPLFEFLQAFELMRQGDQQFDWTVPSDIDMELKLRSRCRGFVEVQQSFTRNETGAEYIGPIAQFLHQSVKDFLRDSQTFDEIRDKLKGKFPNAKGLLDENGYAYMLRFRVSQHFRKYGQDPTILGSLNSFDLSRFDVFYFAYMVELNLKRTICEPLDALGGFADAYGFVPVYLSHQGWRVPLSWQPTFLALCVQAGLLMYVDYRIRHHGELRNGMRRPLLHYAVAPMPESLSKDPSDPFFAWSKMVKLLARLGADVREKFDDATAFAYAIEAFYERGSMLTRSQRLILEELLRHGAEPDPKFRKILPPASIHDCPEIRVVTPLQAAVITDDIKTAELLLDYGASIDMLDEEGWAILKKGYLFSDDVKENHFQDDPRGKRSARDQYEEWKRKRAEAIASGQNKKPLLVLIEKHIERRQQSHMAPPNQFDARSRDPSPSGLAPVPRLAVEPIFGSQRRGRPSIRLPLTPDPSAGYQPLPFSSRPLSSQFSALSMNPQASPWQFVDSDTSFSPAELSVSPPSLSPASTSMPGFKYTSFSSSRP